MPPHPSRTLLGLVAPLLCTICNTFSAYLLLQHHRWVRPRLLLLLLLYLLQVCQLPQPLAVGLHLQSQHQVHLLLMRPLWLHPPIPPRPALQQHLQQQHQLLPAAEQRLSQCRRLHGHLS
jgi:hypothetical protein